MKYALKIVLIAFIVLMTTSTTTPLKAQTGAGWFDPDNPWNQEGQFLCADVSCAWCPYDNSYSCAYAGEFDEEVCQLEFVVCGDPDNPLGP